MDRLKKTAKMALRPLVFMLVFAVLLIIINYVLTPKNQVMSTFYAEPKNTIDVLFVGGSHDTAAFNPTQIWHEQGFTSYTLYSWSQPPWVSYHYIKEALKTQSPKVVVLESFGLLYNNTYLSPENNDMVADDHSLLIRPGLNRVAMARAMSASQINSRPFYRYASLLRYHARWWNLTADDFTWAFQDHASTNKGFGPNLTTEAFPAQTLPDDRPLTPLYPAAEQYLHKLIALAEEEGFQLVLAGAPYVIESDAEWGAYDTLAGICAENDIPFIDYNRQPGQDIGFDFATDMAEHAHVNLFGAYKISTHIGAFLKENYQLTDRKNDPAYADWHTASEQETWDLTKVRLRISPHAGVYFPQLNNPNMAAFVVSRGNISAPGNEHLLAGFAALGLDAAALQGDAAATLAVLDGGVLVKQTSGDELREAFEFAGHSLELYSSSGECSLMLDGKEKRLDYDGVAVLVLDKTNGSVIQTVVFCPPEQCITRTD